MSFCVINILYAMCARIALTLRKFIRCYFVFTFFLLLVPILVHCIELVRAVVLWLRQLLAGRNVCRSKM